jgi:hypothetical protein
MFLLSKATLHWSEERRHEAAGAQAAAGRMRAKRGQSSWD